MYLHANAKLGLAGRLALVGAIEQGCSLKAAAAAFSVSPATAHRWWHRWDGAGEQARSSLGCLLDRPSRPHPKPARARLRAAGADLRLPPRDRLGPAPGRRRHRLRALDRLESVEAGRHLPSPRSPREPANSYEWPCPGDLLHMDVSRYARFERSGHAVTGDRSPRWRRSTHSQTLVGYDFAHAIVDDHSRLAYVELHRDERAATVTAFVERALASFESQGMTVKRLMTDNAFSYAKNRSLGELLAARAIKHLTTKPYRPRTNGKVERFHQTMAREWAYGVAYRSHRHRNQALPDWLDHYNRRRPHSSLGDRPPISRVHNVCG